MKARQMAFGGMMTAVSIVIMALGSIIPLNTYTCPVVCIFLTRPVWSGAEGPSAGAIIWRS